MLERSPSRFKGRTYEATYLGWLEFFRELAEAPERIRIVRSPLCWSPFLRYMGHVVSEPVSWFLEDSLFSWPSTDSYEACRRVVEVSSTCRPELAHALRLWDTEWVHGYHAQKRIAHQRTHRSKEFVVASSGGFFRQEVLEFLSLLEQWEPPADYRSRTVILCPPAADKPYPAPLHDAIQKTVPESFLIVATAVLGLIPQDLWSAAPNYDSGVPYHERVYKVALDFFRRHPHPAPVIVYCERMAYWLTRSLDEAGQPYVSVFGNAEIPDYYDLSSAENLKRLKEAL